jgi:hypothetical protein|tara:strand:- start:5209 stop:5568 length:360 start_codon:yes stop_codon:yes gene_type:complete
VSGVRCQGWDNVVVVFGVTFIAAGALDLFVIVADAQISSAFAVDYPQAAAWAWREIVCEQFLVGACRSAPAGNQIVFYLRGVHAVFRWFYAGFQIPHIPEHSNRKFIWPDFSSIVAMRI